MLGGFLTGDMDDMIIDDIMNDVFYPKENTLKILCYIIIGSVSGMGGQ